MLIQLVALGAVIVAVGLLGIAVLEYTKGRI